MATPHGKAGEVVDMAKKQTRSDLAKFLETPLGGIDRAFCDFQLAGHWLLYAAAGARKREELRHHLQAAAFFAERGLKQVRELLKQSEAT
jgi:hypothetical protein